MKRILFTFLALTITTTCVLCQEIVTDKFKISESKSANDKAAESGRTYTFHDITFDSNTLLKDTIKLFKEPVNKSNPRLELGLDSKFRIIYDLKYDTISTVNNTTGLYEQKILLDSKVTGGKYGIWTGSGSDGKLKEHSLHLIFDNGNRFDFDMENGENQIILIKQ
ncbi:hypothetical protein [Carboxylicivirga marina]|uniref:hypothetical protein n=1 Tax=Carboxylicivirga marina TaxID=2800988 RepID=UPI002594710B|nr:hypothetical protein [uncultured Carboxylicivirga sp.]